MRLDEALGPGPRLVVEIPIERGGEIEAVRRLQPERFDICDEDEQRREPLSARGNAEFVRRLDRVDLVGARIGEADDLRLRRLSLQQVRAEIAGAERMADRAQHLASGRLDEARGVALQRIAEGVVDGEEVPSLAALLHD